ncbi:MAG: DNA polymerase III subunit delta [Lachnospiraceae bacterium]|nr:DNA polymerase III subunit delta [Lachnospiraceae bacterium]
MKKLKQDISDHAFEPVYLIYGPEAFLRQNAKNALRKALTGDDSMNYTYREGREIVFPEIRDIAETLPFFADRRLIVLENSGLFKKGGDVFADYLPEMPETTVMVFVEEEIDKRSRLYKAITRCGYAAECARLKENDLRKSALTAFHKAGCRITEDALDLFVDRCGDDLGHMITEQEKLIAYCMNKDGIRVQDVENVTTVTAQNRVFDMLDAMATGYPKEAFELYEDLRSLKEPPMRILYLITQQVNRLLQIKELSTNGLSQNAIAEELGIRPFAVGMYSRQARRFSEAELKERLARCAEYDLAVKSGNLEDAVAVELLLAGFSRK